MYFSEYPSAPPKEKIILHSNPKEQLGTIEFQPEYVLHIKSKQWKETAYKETQICPLHQDEETEKEHIHKESKLQEYTENLASITLSSDERRQHDKNQKSWVVTSNVTENLYQVLARLILSLIDC